MSHYQQILEMEKWAVTLSLTLWGLFIVLLFKDIIQVRETISILFFYLFNKDKNEPLDGGVGEQQIW
jgi:hypothetical protein